MGMSNDVRCCGSKCEAGCDTDHGTVEDYKGNKSITNKHAGQINALINKGFTNVVDDMYFASCKGSERRSCPSCSKYSKSYLTSKEDKYKGKGAYAYFGINSERYGSSDNSITIHSQGMYHAGSSLGNYNIVYTGSSSWIECYAIYAPIIPIITLRNDLKFFTGEGTIDSPYSID